MAENTTAAKKTAAKKAAEPVGAIKDGVYVEENVELTNGAKIPVEVIIDNDELPATFASLVAEGNAAALNIAMMTVRTRRVLDMAGATNRDLREVLGPVIERARKTAGEEAGE